MNKTILNKVRYMLFNSKLSKRIWVEVVQNTTHLINISPILATNFNAPEERWS